jgi:hypothetical protein
VNQRVGSGADMASTPRLGQKRERGLGRIEPRRALGDAVVHGRHPPTQGCYDSVHTATPSPLTIATVTLRTAVCRKLATGRGCQPDSLSYAVPRPAEPLGQAPHAGAVRNARLRSLLDSPAVATAARWRVPGFAIAARIRGSWCRPRVSPHGVAPTHRVGADHLVPWRVSPPISAPIHCPTRLSKIQSRA